LGEKYLQSLFLLSDTPVQLPDQWSEFMLSLNRFQLEGRYPEYLTKMYNICDESFTSSIEKTANELRLWLQEKLQ
jgi:hypothetical protein